MKITIEFKFIGLIVLPIKKGNSFCFRVPGAQAQMENCPIKYLFSFCKSCTLTNKERDQLLFIYLFISTQLKTQHLWWHEGALVYMALMSNSNIFEGTIIHE